MSDQDENKYSDFSNVETARRFVLPEDFPEGPYGSPIVRKLGKSTPWKEDQRYYSAFNYENKSLHEGIERKFPGAHPTHDDPERSTQDPYTDVR
ncbi:hypothetical protein ACFFJY_05235 [Fictibacillus aquaticus]|uniref:Cytosolic protein n=1 Tax=Fictibacillus aquaticus TaxID=2021314 RepID=A0A235F8U9_9BACL|nr:hypothetical protein [Fictibacillus aquaticus]OYD57115.1 hypothetical protein CGZ90_13945 [Fictibacillus aquaticus]